MSASRRPSRRRARLAAAVTALAAVAAVVWAALTIGNPFPPRTIVMATGPEGSAAAEFGARYREILGRSGVDLRLIQTAGGVENLDRLGDAASGVGVAFLECGLTSREQSPNLRSLGAVSLEPMWIFLRGPSQQGTPAERLQGRRISIEPEGSATQLVARRLLALNGVAESSVDLLALTPEQSADALLRGEIDGAMTLTSWRSPAVQQLLVAEGIVLESYARADAYVARFPCLNKVVLPTGVADLARNIPRTDVSLLAIEASLVVREDVHPAIQYLLLEAASEVHGGPEIFHRAGRFPAADAIDLPLSDQARAFYKSGLPFVYRYLPYWAAGVVERLLILLIPLFAVVLPVAHFFPTAYGYLIESRIFRLYGELKVLEMELEQPELGAGGLNLVEALEDLARRASHLKVPNHYAQRLFILKDHIARAQEEAEKRRHVAARGTTP